MNTNRTFICLPSTGPNLNAHVDVADISSLEERRSGGCSIYTKNGLEIYTTLSAAAVLELMRGTAAQVDTSEGEEVKSDKTVVRLHFGDAMPMLYLAAERDPDKPFIYPGKLNPGDLHEWLEQVISNISAYRYSPDLIKYQQKNVEIEVNRQQEAVEFLEQALPRQYLESILVSHSSSDGGE